MNIQTFARFGRVLVCLLLVCCILVNAWPVRAGAVSIDSAEVIEVPAENVVASILIGLGFLPGSDFESWASVVQDFSGSETLQVVYFPGAVPEFMVSDDIVSEILGFFQDLDSSVFSSMTLQPLHSDLLSFSLPDVEDYRPGFVYYVAAFFPFTLSYQYALVGSYGGASGLFFSRSGPSIQYVNGKGCYVLPDDSFVCISTDDGDLFASGSFTLECGESPLFFFDVSPCLEPVFDIGNVDLVFPASEEIALSEWFYPTWCSNSLTYTLDGEECLLVPLALGADLETTAMFSQQDVWRGGSHSGSPDAVLSGILSADMLLGSIDEIVALLPAALVVIVSCLGLRKGISYIQRVLRGA